MPWRLTVAGVVLVLVTALVGGFLLAYWSGSPPRRGAAPIAPVPPAASAPDAMPPKAAAAPATATPPKAAAAAAPLPPKATPAPAPAPKVAAVPAPPPQPAAPVPAPVKRSRPESAPAPAVKPRAVPAVPSQADVDACARYATVQAEAQEKTATDDDQDRKSDEAYQKAYASCMQARGFKKAGRDD